jgi:hypothetical protein
VSKTHAWRARLSKEINSNFSKIPVGYDRKKFNLKSFAERMKNSCGKFMIMDMWKFNFLIFQELKLAQH